MSAQVIIRPERAADIPAIRAVHDAAFMQPDEGLIVDGIRGTPDWIEGGSIVASQGPDGLVVGHLLLSRGTIDGDSEAREAWMLGPLAVLPDWQRRGIGTRLMKAGLDLARSQGAAAVIVLGHASYYLRFGFEPARAFGIEPPAQWPDEAWMVLRLSGWTPDHRGVARYSPAFGINAAGDV